MKVYVDELPKDCIDCPCESEYYCNLLNEDVGCLEWGEIHKGCPLQSLADYTKQVRKEVVDIIEEKFNCCGYVEEKFEDIKKYVLDQLQGESKCLN